jgi:GH24 family phage-related lysozyme (muramidase)
MDKETFIKHLQPVLETHEGKKNHPYQDTKGIWTIGIGHNMSSPLPSDMEMALNANGFITDEMIAELFSKDMEIAIDSCYKIYPDFDNFPEKVQIALVDIMFNFGLLHWQTAFANTIHLINTKKWDAVEYHLRKSLWYTQVGQRAKDDVELIHESEGTAQC